MNNFVEHIKNYCLENNLSLKQLAKLVKIQDSLLYKYVNGMSIPTINNLVKLSNFFGCSLNYLVGLDENPKLEKLCKSYKKKEFFNRYVNLLKKNNTSHYNVSKELNFAMSSFGTWKKGSIPYLNTLIKIAQHFGVSIDYLIGRTDDI